MATGAFGWKIIAAAFGSIAALFVALALFSGHLSVFQGDSSLASNLTVFYLPSPGDQAVFTVSCHASSLSGTHPNKKNVCSAITKQGTRLFAPVPNGTACTQIYGGPETARVVGNVRGDKINTTFSRTDGCQIARWETAQALFTFPAYATVQGRIEVSPTCPGPEQPGQNCTNRSAAGIVSFTSNSQESVTAKALADRGFAVLLRNGTWSIAATAVGAMSCAPSSIAVPTAGELVIACDTGMR
ncbi:MAG TPA: hypothetical protein VMV52_00095 [Candidatus Nanopelagicaceae bacterium]|nr:hypothetical protein [Candidatus Nanopelagicaceae bacterium]